MTLLPQLLINGVAIGMIYSLIALGLVLILRSTNILNLAQGEMVMIGAFLCLILYVHLGVPLYLATILASAVVALLAIVTQKLSVQFVRNPTVTNMITATLAVSIILKDGSRIIFGSDIWPFPFVFGREALVFWNLRIAPQNIAIIVVSVSMMTILHLFLRKTRVGLSIRAVMGDQETACLMGIHPMKVITLVFAISGILGAVAGIMIMPVFFVSFSMGYIIFKSLVAAVIGGIYSFPGAVIGGVLLGVGETLLSAYAPAGLRDIVIYSLLIAFLLLKPYGLLGKS